VWTPGLHGLWVYTRYRSGAYRHRTDGETRRHLEYLTSYSARSPEEVTVLVVLGRSAPPSPWPTSRASPLFSLVPDKLTVICEALTPRLWSQRWWRPKTHQIAVRRRPRRTCFTPLPTSLSRVVQNGTKGYQREGSFSWVVVFFFWINPFYPAKALPLGSFVLFEATQTPSRGGWIQSFVLFVLHGGAGGEGTRTCCAFFGGSEGGFFELLFICRPALGRTQERL